VLPRPVSACRYFHRSLNYRTLCEVRFTSSFDVEAGVKKYQVPHSTDVEGLREMEERDVDEVRELWARYGKRFDMALQFDKKEIEHWFVPKKEMGEESVLWSYVVEVCDSTFVTICFFNVIDFRMKRRRSQTSSLSIAWKPPFSTLRSNRNQSE